VTGSAPFALDALTVQLGATGTVPPTGSNAARFDDVR
jgi:hypothetical protein